jgi:hypothetical protein
LHAKPGFLAVAPPALKVCRAVAVRDSKASINNICF